MHQQSIKCLNLSVHKNKHSIHAAEKEIVVIVCDACPRLIINSENYSFSLFRIYNLHRVHKRRHEKNLPKGNGDTYGTLK